MVNKYIKIIGLKICPLAKWRTARFAWVEEAV
jgi:hypothetical protein